MKRNTRITSTLSIALLISAVTTLSAATAAVAPSPTAQASKVVQTSTATSTDYELHAKQLQLLAPKKLPLHREFRAAISKDAKDWKGYEKSMYGGKYYHKDQEHFRECVMYRESRHNYRAANKTSSARGAYQFLERSWKDGLIYMMIKESKKSKDGLIPEIKELRTKPIVKWNRYFQDRAFFTAMNINGKWSGKHHWRFTVPGTGC
jgi:hypothetical protein